MSFSDWRLRSKLFVDVCRRNWALRGDIERACAAAYKAGQRDERKVCEAIAENAILLKYKMGQKHD